MKNSLKSTAATAPTTEAQPDTIVDNAQLDAFDNTGRKVRQLTGKNLVL